MSNESKYDKAVTKAQRKSGELIQPETKLVAPGTETMVRDSTPEDIAARLATGKYEAAPQLLSLKAGQEITGILEGHGPVAEFADQDTGVIKEVNTWVIADSTRTVRVSILSSAQLDKKLNGFIGGEVTIARQGDVNIGGGRRMTEYIVFGPRLANGRQRQWFDVPDSERMIETHAEQRALPAAAMNHAIGHDTAAS